MQSRPIRFVVTVLVALALSITASSCARSLSTAEKIALAIAHGFAGSVSGYEACVNKLGGLCN